jgi:hypothetical protein
MNLTDAKEVASVTVPSKYGLAQARMKMGNFFELRSVSGIILRGERFLQNGQFGPCSTELGLAGAGSAKTERKFGGKLKRKPSRHS